jgi:hypothetical protein
VNSRGDKVRTVAIEVRTEHAGPRRLAAIRSVTTPQDLRRDIGRALASSLPVQVQLAAAVGTQRPLRVDRIEVPLLLDLLEHQLSTLWFPLQAVCCGQ